jgi:thiamine biosynthesis lipoprotein ApbE
MRIDRFSAMGCDVVVGGAAAAEVAGIEALFRERDERFSRFRAESELSRVNAAHGRFVRISADFGAMVRRALRAARSTEGLVDPTLGDAIEAVGYDRDFDELSPLARPAQRGEAGRWRSLRLYDGWLSRTPGLRLDLNGVAKGQTVDDALELMAGDGFVSAGGDLASRGPVDVALPEYGSVRLVEGGLATSGSARRRWLRAGLWQHHLIDPRSGMSSESPWLEVTVSAATCLQADVAAKAAFLLGLGGPAWLDARGLAGRFVLREGKTLSNLTWRRSISSGEAAA